MRAWRHAAWIICLLVLCQAVIVVVASAIFPDRQVPLDTAEASATLFLTEPKLVVYDIGRLARPGPKVILLGASNVREGLRPAELSPRLGGIEVDNLAVGATNMREIAEVVDLVHWATPTSTHRDLTFVLGIWYGTFVDDKRRWPNGQTAVDVEMLRYSLFAPRDGGTPRPVLGTVLTPFAIKQLKSILLLSYLRNQRILPMIESGMARLPFLVGAPDPPSGPAGDHDTLILSDPGKRTALGNWLNYMGPVDQWTDAGLGSLVALAARIIGAGGRLIVLDLPIPSWHADNIPYFSEYQRRKTPFIDKLRSMDRVTYADLQSGFIDGDFYDSAHPRPKVTAMWADRAAAVLSPALDARP
jgi:hypothetical protein